MKNLHVIALAGLVWAAGPLLGEEATTATSTPAPSSTSTSTNSPVLDQEIRELKPLDTLRYNISEDPRGQGIFPSVQITEAGVAAFPISASSQDYIKVKAAGRTLADLRKELKEKLDADYYQNATVNLDLLKTRESEDRPKGSTAKVIVHGAISATVPLLEGEKKFLSELFAQLSDRSQDSKLNKVELQRMDPVTKKRKSIIKNVQRMLDKGDLTDDVELQDGDLIKVEFKTFNF